MSEWEYERMVGWRHRWIWCMNEYDEWIDHLMDEEWEDGWMNGGMNEKKEMNAWINESAMF